MNLFVFINHIKFKIMRKTLLAGIAVLTIALTMALSLNFGAKNNNLSDISLANVEALARNEGDDCKSNGGPECPHGCISDYDPNGCFCHTFYHNIKEYCW